MIVVSFLVVQVRAMFSNADIKSAVVNKFEVTMISMPGKHPRYIKHSGFKKSSRKGEQIRKVTRVAVVFQHIEHPLLPGFKAVCMNIVFRKQIDRMQILIKIRIRF